MKRTKKTSTFLARGSTISFLIIRTNEGAVEHLTRSLCWSPVMMTKNGQKVPVTEAQQLRCGSFINEKQFQDLFLPASIILNLKEEELKEVCAGPQVTIFETVTTAGEPLTFFLARRAMLLSLTASPSG